MSIPTSDFDEAAPGTVVFTKEGYLLHRKIYLALYGRKNLQQYDSFYSIREKARQVHYCAPTKQLCLDFIRKLRQVSEEGGNISGLLSRPAKVTRVRGPDRIGRWKPSRHLTLRCGYRVIVHYKTVRRRRIRTPELELDATIENFEPPFITGTIAGDRFTFGERFAWTSSPFDDRNALFTWFFDVAGGFSRLEDSRSVICGETRTAGGRIIPHYLYRSEETPPDERRRMLSVVEAKEILTSCARQYLDHRRHMQGETD